MQKKTKNIIQLYPLNFIDNRIMCIIEIKQRFSILLKHFQTHQIIINYYEKKKIIMFTVIT